jgi:hypothetical protein
VFPGLAFSTSGILDESDFISGLYVLQFLYDEEQVWRIWKKVQKLGLTEQYKNNPAVQQHVRRASALPLVPTDQVDNVWFHALNDFQTDDINITRFNNFQTDDINITRFNDYVTEQWVKTDNQW